MVCKEAVSGQRSAPEHGALEFQPARNLIWKLLADKALSLEPRPFQIYMCKNATWTMTPSGAPRMSRPLAHRHIPEFTQILCDRRNLKAICGDCGLVSTLKLPSFPTVSNTTSPKIFLNRCYFHQSQDAFHLLFDGHSWALWGRCLCSPF